MCQFATVLLFAQKARKSMQCGCSYRSRTGCAEGRYSAWTTTAECLKAPVFLAISKVHGERTEILSSSLCCYKKHLDCQIQFQSLPIWRGSLGSVTVPTLQVLYLCPTPSSSTLLRVGVLHQRSELSVLLLVRVTGILSIRVYFYLTILANRLDRLSLYFA